MRTLYVIGIGAGDPDQVTMQAIKALRQVDVFFVIGKGDEKRELVEVRRAVLAEHADHPHRIVEIDDPPRDRAPDDYRDTVSDWHERRSLLLEAAFAAHDGVGAILVWGDPALYDSTLRMVERILARGALDFDYTVIPGITSVHALAARHRTVLHRVGEPVQITTGRRLREEGLGSTSTVVMLDGDCAFTGTPADTEIWWGAYLGMPDETLIAGRVGEVGAEIVRRRAELRERKGWIMDTYLLRPAEQAGGQPSVRSMVGMTEQDILGRIKGLVDDEHDLRSRASRGELDPDLERQRLAELEVMLDQCWDLLRQRRARLASSEAPDEAEPRSPGQVEGYLQ